MILGYGSLRLWDLGLLAIKLTCNKVRFVALACVFLNIIGEEEYLQHHKDDEELHRDDEPQRASECHAAETIIIEVPYVSQERFWRVWFCQCFHLNGKVTIK